MKIFVKLLILVGILACAAPFFLSGPDGRPLMQMSDLSLPDLSFWDDVKRESKQLMGDEEAAAGFKTYKWVDAEGITHYSDANDPQRKGKVAAMKGISVVPLYKPTPRAINNTTTPSKNSVNLSANPLQNVSKLIDDTKQVKKIMEGRESQLNKVLSRH